MRLGKSGPDRAQSAPDDLTGIDEGWNYAPGASVADEINRLLAAKRAKLPWQIATDLLEAVAASPGGPTLPTRKTARRAGAQRSAILSVVAPSAYAIAMSGGRHAGLLQDYANKSDGEISRAIRSLRRQVAIHRQKIAKPMDWVEPGIDTRHLSALVSSYWPKEIANFQQQIAILERIVEERQP
ncbi:MULTISPECIES: hypothetical protein [unclassified Thiocapsa]|uniref:hypothetical protein n=1 Tax=unclassified Thiocapsa TaxID=2641286 RepID=UPI0035AF03B1